MANKTCHCVIKHSTTPTERKEASAALAYARRVGDSLGIMLALARLTGKCPANAKE